MTGYGWHGAAAAVLGGLAWTAAAIPTQAPAPAAAPVPVVVELFTSEGCSSCPPADDLLIDLMAHQPVKGALIIGLSEHVDYWNQLGWTDPFSSAAFSRRQNEYAAGLRASDVYTPQMIVDGAEPLVGSDRKAALAAIARAAATPKPAVRLRWVTASPRTLEVSLDANPGTVDATVMLAVVEDGLQSSVSRGENQGRRLAHGAVTRRLTSLGKTDRSGVYHATPAVTIDASWKPSAVRIVVFAQRHGRAGIASAGTIGVQ